MFWAAEAAVGKGEGTARASQSLPPAVQTAQKREVQLLATASPLQVQSDIQRAAGAAGAAVALASASSAPDGHWEERFVPGHFPPRRVRRWVEEKEGSNV
jgi:hypothetical protein